MHLAMGRPLTAALALIVLSAAPRAERAPSAVPTQPDDKTIVHVLNRAAFGPRPGDVARVQQMGLGAWIEAQLNPGRRPDASVEARLAGFDTLKLSSREIAEDYFLPMVEARRERKAAPAGKRSDPAPADEQSEAAPARAKRGPEVEGMRRVVAELTAQKILRAVYSDRQLEEVLT